MTDGFKHLNFIIKKLDSLQNMISLANQLETMNYQSSN